MEARFQTSHPFKHRRIFSSEAIEEKIDRIGKRVWVKEYLPTIHNWHRNKSASSLPTCAFP